MPSRVLCRDILLCSFILWLSLRCIFFFFFFNDPATPEIYPLSLPDALPIYGGRTDRGGRGGRGRADPWQGRDRKSTRLNSSHSQNSYAVFCLKKKKKTIRRKYPYPTTVT